LTRGGRWVLQSRALRFEAALSMNWEEEEGRGGRSLSLDLAWFDTDARLSARRANATMEMIVEGSLNA